MSEEVLSQWLDGLGTPQGERSEFTIDPARAFERLGQQHSAEPGLWAVKWVQGAVAARATEVRFKLGRQRVQVGCYPFDGSLQVEAQQLMETMLGGRIPSGVAHRHWSSALRGLAARKPSWLAVSTHQGQERTVAFFRDGKMEVRQDQKVDGPALQLDFAPARSTPVWRSRSAWLAEKDALVSRLQFCTLPVLIDGAGISRRSPYDGNQVMISLLEPAQEGQPHFLMYGDPAQILSPRLLKTGDKPLLPQRCALMLAVSQSPGGSGRAHVFWMRDGALIGPIPVAGSTGAIALDIICPGDHPEVDLSEWALRDPASFFPQALVLKVARRLVAGLDSLTMDLSVRQVEQRGLFGSGAAHARVLRAMEGGVLAALRAFSLRDGLELGVRTEA